jgi:hypothetical protein
MTQRSVTYLKSRFENADIPTQSDYQDLFDSYLSLEASAAQSLNGELNAPIVSAGTLSAAKIVRSATQNVSAAGTTQASATRITTDCAYVMANDNERAVAVATCEPGRVQYIVNSNTTTITVFPASGGNFIGTAENAGLLLAKLGTMIIQHATASAYGVVRMQGV